MKSKFLNLKEFVLVIVLSCLMIGIGYLILLPFAANMQLLYFLEPGLIGLVNGIVYVLMIRKCPKIGTQFIDFDKIDRSVDLKGLQADVEDAKKNGGGDFPTIPAGKYEVKLESMEIKGTKADPNRPMLAVSFKILSGEFKNQRLFMNRVLYGTKNDKNMIASAMGFLEKLDSGVPISFTSYKQFAQLVLDVAEAIDGTLEYAVDYDDSRFNSITVDEVFEVEN